MYIYTKIILLILLIFNYSIYLCRVKKNTYDRNIRSWILLTVCLLLIKGDICNMPNYIYLICLLLRI